MPRYMVTGTYDDDGMKGLLKEGGTARRDVCAKLCADLGGHLEAAYFAFGQDDVHVIVDLPDNVTMAAVSMVVNAAGVGRARTAVLLTPEEIDEATRKSINYRAPTPPVPPPPRRYAP
jgi:uncharacterized protein with GYD domain